MILTIKIYLDGNKYCALVGSDLQEGLVGFGDSPKFALRNLLENLLLADLEALLNKHAKKNND
jgi:hypothetical protein